MRCSQCNQDHKKDEMFGFYSTNIFVCKDCANRNLNSKNNSLVLLELDYITQTNNIGDVGRGVFLLLKRYEKDLPEIDFNESPDEAVVSFIKAFRQRDCIPNDDDNIIPMDMVIWHILNGYNGFLQKAISRVKDGRSIFQEEY